MKYFIELDFNPMEQRWELGVKSEEEELSEIGGDRLEETVWEAIDVIRTDVGKKIAG